MLRAPHTEQEARYFGWSPSYSYDWWDHLLLDGGSAPIAYPPAWPRQRLVVSTITVRELDWRGYRAPVTRPDPASPVQTGTHSWRYERV